MKVSVYRKESFNAAHRLYNHLWNDAKNEAVFGKCSWPNYHGHNYVVQVKVTGEVDRKTGFVIDLKYLGDLIQTEIVEKFDHKNFNLDIEAFKNMNPSAENIAIEIYNILRIKLAADLDLQIRLYETERNFVEYPVS